MTANERVGTNNLQQPDGLPVGPPQAATSGGGVFAGVRGIRHLFELAEFVAQAEMTDAAVFHLSADRFAPGRDITSDPINLNPSTDRGQSKWR